MKKKCGIVVIVSINGYLCDVQVTVLANWAEQSQQSGNFQPFRGGKE